VILLSNEPDLRSLFERALGRNECLVVAGGDEELRRALATPAATVVISVGVSDRIESWRRIRELHQGMVLVAVDTAEQTHDWPADVARRFLVRPFGVEEIMASLAVHPRILREPAAARRRRLAKAQGPPVIPLPALPPPPEAGVEPVRRLETGESLWDTPMGPAEPGPAAGAEPAAAAGAEPAPAKPVPPMPAQKSLPAPAVKTDPPPPAPASSGRGTTASSGPGATASSERATAAAEGEPARGGTTTTKTRERARTNGTGTAPAAPPRQREPVAPPAATPDRRRVGLLVAVVALLLAATSAGGIAIGRATAPASTGGASPGTPATPSTAAPGVVIKEKAPAACDAALSDADAAISYLVGNVRDDRLTKSMQSYQQNRRACRAASR
jgi:hypothetical protein